MLAVVTSKAIKEKMMNSSATSDPQITPSECEIPSFLQGGHGQTALEVYVVLVLIAFVNVITCPFTIVLNTLVIMSVNNKPRMKTNSNLVLGCLATTDWVMGIIGQPLFVAWIAIVLQGKASSVNCSVMQLAMSTITVLASASILHLALMNVERCIAIKRSFRYIAMITKARIVVCSILVWITTLLLTIPVAIIDEFIYGIISSYLLISSIAIIIFIQVVIFFEVRRHKKAIAVQQVSLDARKKFLEEKKAFKVTTIVVITVLLTYMPIFVLRILAKLSVISSVTVLQIAYFIAISMLILCSTMNPITYCFRIRQFRIAFIEILLRKSNALAEEIEKKHFGKLNAVVPLEVGPPTLGIPRRK